MAKIQDRRINGDLSFNADLVYCTLLVANSSLGLTYTDTTGFVQVGTLSPAGDQSYSVGVDTEEVVTGTPETVKDDLISRLNGEASFMITDLNPHAAKYAMGTTAEIQWTTAGVATAYANTITGSSSTKQVLYVTTADTVVENDILKIELSSGANAYYYPGIVAAKDTTANTITLKYPLPEIPVADATVELVGGYSLYHGGNTLQNLTALVQCDFPKGDQHLMEIFKCSATSGFERQMGGAVKTPITLKMYGTLKDIGSLTDQVTLAATHVQFPNYAV